MRVRRTRGRHDRKTARRGVAEFYFCRRERLSCAGGECKNESGTHTERKQQMPSLKMSPRQVEFLFVVHACIVYAIPNTRYAILLIIVPHQKHARALPCAYCPILPCGMLRYHRLQP